MKVFISYSSCNKQRALEIVRELKANSFEVLGDFEIQPGEGLINSLDEMLLKADIFVCLITPEYNKSEYAIKELNNACAYSKVSNKLMIIPIVFEGTEVPTNVNDILYLAVGKEPFEDIVRKLVARLNAIRIDNKNRYEAEVKEKEVFHENLSTFIENTMSRLKENEKKNKQWAYLCYVGSVLSVLVAIWYSVCRISVLGEISEWQIIAIKMVEGTLTLALILALSRLLFVLGKAFMVEAIRNSNRIHAISFGEFFLNAYGNVATREEVREVFGDWNIDTGSTFITQSPKDYNPQIVENLVNAVNAFKDVVSK